MRKAKTVIKWVASIFFVLFGLVCIGGSVISGTLFFIGAIIINPIFQGIFEKNGKKIKKRVYIPVLAVAFFAGVMTSNNSTTTIKENVSQNEETSSEVDQNATETKQNTSNENIQKEAAIENQTAKDEKTEESNDVAKKNDSTFSMHFIDVDQGDSTLVECDGEYMLIDGGNGYKGTTVQLYLTKQGVKELKYVVGTHPDVDHIGGLDVIITKYSCGDVFLPNRTSETETYAELMDAMNYKSYKATCPNLGDVYTLGSSKITVIGPVDYDGDDNNCSIALKIDYGNTSFILSGDAESDEEAEILSKNSNLKANVYHAGHHGGRTSSSDSWLKEISPEAVVISCGKGNSYGHPHAEALASFKKIGASVYRTDEQGNIVVSSDGETLTWSTSPSESWVSGGEQENNENEVVPIAEEPKEEFVPDNQTTYVLNTNTKKFHYSYCSSASDIKAKNRKEVTCTRDEVINMGYQACKRCNP